MATAVFDTLQASRKLQAAGISEPHAEAIVSSMSEAFSDTVATRADIAALEATTRADIAALEATTKADFAALEATTKADFAEVRGEIAEIKAEIAALRVATKADLAAHEASTKADIANLKAEMFRALWIQGGSIVALIVGLLKFT